MTKKFISIFLAVMILTSMFTGVVFAESKTAEVSQHYALYVRSGTSYADKQWVSKDYLTWYEDRWTYALYDFEDDLPYIYAADKIDVYVERANSYSGVNIKALTMTALDDVYEQYVDSALTYNTSRSYGMHSGGYVIASTSDATA